MRSGFFFFLLIVVIPSFSASDFYREQTQERISPIGKVRVDEEVAEKKEGEPATDEKTQKVAKKEPGAEIYETYCHVCHATGVAGAPKFRVGAEWDTRLKEKGMDKMVANAIKGINAMPPKGTCMKCTDEEIKQAVAYMVPQS